MKRILAASIIILITKVAFAQKLTTDPSYSKRNYKQANKIALANINQLEKTVVLQPTLVRGGSEFKHHYNQSIFTVRGAARTKKMAQERKGYKHPMGL